VKRYLDVACGTGFPLLEVAGRLAPGALSWGVDPWAAALVRAQKKIAGRGLTGIELVEADAARLPFADASFDLVTSNLGLNNFAQPGAVLAEIARVVAPTGWFCLTTNPVGTWAEFYDVFRQLLAESGSETARQALEALEVHIAHRGTLESLTGQLAEAGFRVVHCEARTQTWRFASAAAFLDHSLIASGFAPAWKAVLAAGGCPELWNPLAGALDREAARGGELALKVELLYLQAQRVGKPE